MAMVVRVSGVSWCRQLLGFLIWGLLLVGCGLALTVTESTVFTFDRPESFIELQPRWSPTETREISFRFRTHLTHALLLYHTLTDSGEFSYELSVQLENARLKVSHSSDDDYKAAPIGFALNTDEWHSVQLNFSPESDRVTVSVDETTTYVHPIQMMSNNSNDNRNGVISSFLYFGGLNPSRRPKHREYTMFQGCLGNIRLGDEASNLEATAHLQVTAGCKNKCRDHNSCLYGSRCINRYSYTLCDCFKTLHEDNICSNNNLTTVKLRGFAYISYKIYDWDDKVHSDSNRISVTFSTMFDNSVLFFAMGENPVKNYVAAALINGQVQFVIDFGDGPLTATLGRKLNNMWWYAFTMQQKGREIKLTLETEEVMLKIEGEHYYLHLDPYFYIGGYPVQRVKTDFNMKNAFVGSLKEVYFNYVSVLERLKMGDPNVTYHGTFGPDFMHKTVDMLPLTFPFKDSVVFLHQQSNLTLHLRMDFKTLQWNVLLAHSEATMTDGRRLRWQLSLKNGSAAFLALLDDNSIYFQLSVFGKFNNDLWNNIFLKYEAGVVELVANYRMKESGNLSPGMTFSRNITIAGSLLNPELGLIGCLREIYLEKRLVDPRPILLNPEAFHGYVTMDDCQLIDPCRKPDQCEHNGKCYIVDGKTACNCTGTGYMGKTCHFSLFKRSCEELFLVGRKEPGVYMIDIDGNGPHPPAPVLCNINSETGIITTQVEHNLQETKLDIRGEDMGSFRVKIEYRNFTTDMLQTLIEQSKSCSQDLIYECHKAPLKLRSHTWFKSSFSSRGLLTSFGTVQDMYCPCGESGTCVNASLRCNCDQNDGVWREDKVRLEIPKFLGITDMYFLQPEDLASDGAGRIKLGPLQCIEMDTQHYVVTFRRKDTFLQVPGWRAGDLAFSFRTSSRRAVLLHQPSSKENNYFRVFLSNEFVLSFEYTVDGQPRSTNISSRTPLNSGDWQQVWVDYDEQHVRFTINMEYEMINLTAEEHFGPFDGPLYIGGTPKDGKNSTPLEEGFVGCFRGLVINDEIVNLYYYFRVRPSHIVQGCKPSCDPNPCFNGGICHEYWGSYRCSCINKLAHSGIHCEKNLNSNSITLIDGTENFGNLFEDNETHPGFLTENITLSIRTHEEKGLILYAHDHNNNFIQLHTQNVDELVFTYNSRREPVQGILKFPELPRGIPIQIFIDRQPLHTKLSANQHEMVINHPLELVDSYRMDPWTDNKELEIVKPPRPPVTTKPYFQYHLGGVNPDANVESKMGGFIGCIAGLRVGDVNIDIMESISRDPGSEGFRPGCNMTCDTHPCAHNGYCEEQWKTRQRKCDCTDTSYEGKSCDEDKASWFNGNTTINYNFEAKPTYDNVQVRATFSTPVTPERPAILLMINSRVDETNHVFLTLLPDGRLKFEEDNGAGEIISITVEAESGNFADNRRHWVRYVRRSEMTELYVDGIAFPPNITETKPPNPDPNAKGRMDVVILGGIDLKDSGFADYILFNGCLSNVVIAIDGFTLYPLETAFGLRPGGEKVQIHGTIKQGKCAQNTKHSPDVTTPPPGNPTWYFGNIWKPPKLQRIPFSVEPSKPRDDWSLSKATSKRVALGMGCFLIALIVSLGIYLWRVDWKDKQFRYDEADMMDSTTYGLSKKARRTLETKVRDEEPVLLLDKSPSLELEWDPAMDHADLMMGSLDEFHGRTSNPKTYLGTASEVTLSVVSSLPETNDLKDEPLEKPRSPTVSTNEDLPMPPTYEEATRRADVLWHKKPSPVHLMDNVRTFDNPISYLGGPRISYGFGFKDRHESLVSLD